MISVISQPRSGTNFFLCTLQQSLPKAYNVSEFLSNAGVFIQRIPKEIARYETSGFIDPISKNYNPCLDLSTYSKVFAYFKNYDFVIVKMMVWLLMPLFKERRYKEFILEKFFSDFKIKLIRNDLVDVAISMHVARRTKVWDSLSEVERLRNNPNIYSDLEYNFLEIKEEHDRILQYWWFINETKEHNLHAPLEIVYENLLADPGSQWSSCQKYLGIDFKVNSDVWCKKQDKSSFLPWKDRYLKELKGSLPQYYFDVF